jgi:hypothetical protein
VPLKGSSEKIYLYCKLNEPTELNENTTLYKSFIDCREEKNPLSRENEPLRYSKIIEAIKNYSKKVW